VIVQQASGWEAFVWPHWLPIRARLPLIAQITGAVALTALIVGPWWASIPETPLPSSPVVAHSTPIPLASPVSKSPALPNLNARTAAESTSLRPAHLNLDVRHSFGSADLSVTVDGQPAINTRLDGSGKRFKMFGKRAERGYTQSIDLDPGVRVVRVRLRSADAKFDQTRVERFELGSASVAAIRIAADKSGMSLAADHPPLPPAPKAPPATIHASVPPAKSVVTAASQVATPAAMSSQEASAVVDLIQSLRSMLIAIAGFVASAATGFVVQEFLRRRRGLIFAEAAPAKPVSVPVERRRHKRTRDGRAKRYAAD
jgi:hypothetical protein